MASIDYAALAACLMSPSSCRVAPEPYILAPITEVERAFIQQLLERHNAALQGEACAVIPLLRNPPAGANAICGALMPLLYSVYGVYNGQVKQYDIKRELLAPRREGQPLAAHNWANVDADLTRKSVVYVLTNMHTGLQYVGQVRDNQTLNKRLKEHVYVAMGGPEPAAMQGAQLFQETLLFYPLIASNWHLRVLHGRAARREPNAEATEGWFWVDSAKVFWRSAAGLDTLFPRGYNLNAGISSAEPNQTVAHLTALTAEGRNAFTSVNQMQTLGQTLITLISHFPPFSRIRLTEDSARKDLVSAIALAKAVTVEELEIYLREQL